MQKRQQMTRPTSSSDHLRAATRLLVVRTDTLELVRRGPRGSVEEWVRLLLARARALRAVERASGNPADFRETVVREPGWQRQVAATQLAAHLAIGVFLGFHPIRARIGRVAMGERRRGLPQRRLVGYDLTFSTSVTADFVKDHDDSWWRWFLTRAAADYAMQALGDGGKSAFLRRYSCGEFCLQVPKGARARTLDAAIRHDLVKLFRVLGPAMETLRKTLLKRIPSSFAEVNQLLVAALGRTKLEKLRKQRLKTATHYYPGAISAFHWTPYRNDRPSVAVASSGAEGRDTNSERSHETSLSPTRAFDPAQWHSPTAGLRN